MPAYQTLQSNSASLFKEKGSKFFGYAFPINSQDDVQDCLEKIRLEHPKARHICTAFLLGQGDDEYFLTNDDGEPSNSAGAPILGQIRANELTNVFVAVVRYFGGTKLGVGGLIAAYKQTTKEAIEDNHIIKVEPSSSFQFEIDYSDLGSIYSILDKNQINFEIENDQSKALVKVNCLEKDLEKTQKLFERYL